MSYNSFIYLFVFLGAVWLLWALVPQKWRPAVLLGASMVFYFATAKRYIVYILLTAALCWGVGKLLGGLDDLLADTRPALDPPGRKALKKRVQTLKKLAVTGGVVTAAGVLLFVKYLPFGARVLAQLLDTIPGAPVLAVPAFVQPMGLSFFTLMAISYLVDVYRGVCAPAQRYWQVLLYLSFWPHVVEGPFDRYGDLCGALTDPPRPSYRGLTFGMQRILWGLFKKMVIADRANMFVKATFDDWTRYSGAATALGVLLYTLQLYAEFSGCMDIVCGSAELFGVRMAENFRQPFFAASIGEFWRRWHITLGAWLREYVFQPLILSRPMQRFSRFCRDRVSPAAARQWPVWAGLGLTWALIGLWHGAGWLYLLYGLYYFALQWLGELAEPALCRLLPRLPAWRKTWPYRLLCMARTFVLVNFGMLLFRANGVRSAIDMVRSLAVPYTGSLLIKLDARDVAVLAAGAALMLAVDLAHERGVRLRDTLVRRPLPVRWTVYIAGVLAVMVFGAYGDNYDPAAFIYAQF